MEEKKSLSHKPHPEEKGKKNDRPVSGKRPALHTSVLPFGRKTKTACEAAWKIVQAEKDFTDYGQSMEFSQNFVTLRRFTANDLNRFLMTLAFNRDCQHLLTVKSEAESQKSKFADPDKYYRHKLHGILNVIEDLSTGLLNASNFVSEYNKREDMREDLETLLEGVLSQTKELYLYKDGDLYCTHAAMVELITLLYPMCRVTAYEIQPLCDSSAELDMLEKGLQESDTMRGVRRYYNSKYDKE